MDLSILIPSRNEMFLSRTIQDILANIEGETEVIAVLDGAWADPVIPDHPRVTIIYHPESIGQRAATNEAAKLSKAKYLMKVDAHCAFDRGFDVKMMRLMQDNWTMIPTMYNLHAFDWVCQCGHRLYQGPTPLKCEKCGGKMKKEMVWKPRLSRRSEFYRFDTTMHFQYHSARKGHPESSGDIVETMSAQGSCFMLTRKKYWELDICGEEFGSWGQQGTEVACKTWLSGGRLVTNRTTWYSHMFRTQGGDFGFPYSLSGRQVERARELSRNLFFNNRWEKQVRPLSWLIEKFSPLPDWNDPQGKEILDRVIKAGETFYRERKKPPEKGIIFYTDNKLKLKIAHAVQKQLKKIGLPIVSASLKPMSLGKNIYLPLERGYLTMAKQILSALKASTAQVIYFTEHDCFYDSSHFDFDPPEKDTFYYDLNVVKIRYPDGHTLRVDDCKQLSGLVAYRELLLEYYYKLVDQIEKVGFSRRLSFEPGTRGPRQGGIGDYKVGTFYSALPIIDIRHGDNLTQSRWSRDQFRNQKYTAGWQEGDESLLGGWNIPPGGFEKFLS